MAVFQTPDETIIDRLRAHAQRRPDDVAYRFLLQDAKSQVATFGRLHRRVRRLAAHLREYVLPADRALLLYPPGLEFIEAFLACLSAGIIAVPAYPPRRNRQTERLLTIAEDCGPRLILTAHQVLPMVENSELGRVKGLLVLATDDVVAETNDTYELPGIAGNSVAFLQYTSGSTATPRGVIITHRHLMANEHIIHSALRLTDIDLFVSWLPVFHDLGLIGNVLLALYAGIPAVLLSPTSFLREPVRWLRAITDYRGTIAGAPNFAYDLCVRSLTDEQKQGLELSSWRVAYNGAEPIRAETLDRFAEAFTDSGFSMRSFYPCYGLAEATLYVTGGPLTDEPQRVCCDSSALEAGHIVASTTGRCLVSCGPPGEGTTVLAVDPISGTEVSDGQVGELWISSPSVAAGYWGRLEETRYVFKRYLATGDGPYISTGDLGFIHEGQVYLTGRIKDLIIIHGRNIYPQDVEAVVEREAPFVHANGCAAISLDADGEELGLVLEGDRSIVLAAHHSPEELQRLVASIQASIAREFDVRASQVIIVRPGTFPRTSSGKVRRCACLQALHTGALEPVFCWPAGCLTSGNSAVN
jgi:acyl-CoA synthetase (AMP-forming)/AMP-acid ligase II